jgi:transcriptional regulator with XRE-family HTH domain
MRATPKKAGRTARPGSRFLSDVLAANVRDTRSLRRLSQGELAQRMRLAGHQWTRATVSDVERANRNLTVDELAALCLILDATFGELLDPTGVGGRDGRLLDYGPAAIPAERASAWVHGKVRIGMDSDGRSFRIAPADAARGAGALVVGPDLVTPFDHKGGAS